jgi:hypothetical protein
MDIDDLILSRLAYELHRAAENCPKCQGAREHSFFSRGRENIVNCLQCEPIYKLLESLEAALEILKEA